jgi:hypothetical protein
MHACMRLQRAEYNDALRQSCRIGAGDSTHLILSTADQALQCIFQKHAPEIPQANACNATP